MGVTNRVRPCPTVNLVGALPIGRAGGKGGRWSECRARLIHHHHGSGSQRWEVADTFLCDILPLVTALHPAAGSTALLSDSSGQAEQPLRLPTSGTGAA